MRFCMTIHLTISGKVQGVFFRASAKDEADKLGITGWVKNTFDGNVEIMATGNKILMDQFVAWCKHGPKRAVVASIIIIEKDETEFEEFSVLRN